MPQVRSTHIPAFFDAQVSGVGICVNAISNGRTTFLSDYFERAIVSLKSSRHDFAASWKPQLVIIEVGANDLFGGRRQLLATDCLLPTIPTTYYSLPTAYS